MVRLRGTILNIERTAEKKKDDEGIVWEKCIFDVKIDGLSKGADNNKALLKKVIGKKVKVVRWCAFDWHYKIGSKITLEPEEVKSFLE